MIRRSLPALGLALALALTPAAAGAATHHRSGKKAKKATAHYILSLGDSLAVGVQPNAAGQSLPTNQGYADQLFALEKGKVAKAHLVKLGCPGESTGSMITGQGNRGGACPYAKGNQLAQAVAFLRTHHRRGEVPLVTLDIGANDVDNCANAQTGAIDGPCLSAGVSAIAANVPKIAAALYAAAPKGTKLVGMTYYDPFLSEYLNQNTRNVAIASVQLAQNVNKSITTGYTAHGFLVADVSAAFKTPDMSDQGTVNGQPEPIDVANICNLTWMCAPAPVGPNIHANKLGYTLIAQTFAATAGKL